jgi:hypothetical protein
MSGSTVLNWNSYDTEVRVALTYSVVSKWTGFYPLVEVLAFSHGDVAVGLVLMWLSYVKIATVTVCFS